MYCGTVVQHYLWAMLRCQKYYKYKIPELSFIVRNKKTDRDRKRERERENDLGMSSSKFLAGNWQHVIVSHLT